jgi:hypothetical protein
MFLAERVTTSLGRTALPEIFLRTRRCRLVRDAARADVRLLLRTCAVVLVPAMSYLPAFPALRRICSPEYRTPLPL